MDGVTEFPLNLFNLISFILSYIVTSYYTIFFMGFLVLIPYFHNFITFTK